MRSTGCLSFLALALLLTGCSGKFRLPWENDMPDINRIATREPLEIPPDLDLLPPLPGSAGTGAGTMDAKSRSGGESQPKTAGTDTLTQDVPPTAGNILFGTRVAKQTDPVSRDQKEKLPGWIKKRGE
ncbi:MAG: DUF3035 domain-containing protein [Magnetococcus sp. DMHC-1]|nr:DUF3035 domain-containing protein [Magnetococcales bacterium]